MNPMSAAKVQSAMDYTQELVHPFVAANILAPVCLEGPGVHPSNINQIAGEFDHFFQGKLSGLPICPEYHLIARNGEHQICFLYLSVTRIGILGCPQANKLFPIFREGQFLSIFFTTCPIVLKHNNYMDDICLIQGCASRNGKCTCQ